MGATRLFFGGNNRDRRRAKQTAFPSPARQIQKTASIAIDLNGPQPHLESSAKLAIPPMRGRACGIRAKLTSLPLCDRVCDIKRGCLASSLAPLRAVSKMYILQMKSNHNTIVLGAKFNH